MTMIDRLAKEALVSRLLAVAGGSLTVVTEAGRNRYGDDMAAGSVRHGDRLDATIVIRDDRFYRRALLGSDIGIGEAYMDGQWTTPDLVTLTRLMIRNLALVERRGGSRAASPGWSAASPVVCATTASTEADSTSTSTTIWGTTSSACFSTTI